MIDWDVQMYYYKNGQSIIQHKFYRNVPFEEIFSGELKPPWLPDLISNRDTAFFEHYPESEESARRLSTELDDNMFIDF